jgi:hypothetical protein
LEPERRPARRRAASRARSPRPTPRVRTPRQPSTCRSMRRSTAVPARSLGATCFASMGRSAAVPAPRRPTNRAPAYTPHVAAAHSRRTPAMPRSIPGLVSTWCPSHRLNRLVRGYKAGQSFLARAPSRRSPPWAPHGELHPACFSSPTHAASHFVGPPCSSCVRLLVCSSCQLAGGIPPAAAAGQSTTSCASRSSPEPTNHLSASPRP